ncbi:MAG: triosephosphate isomerase [uncultured bacterium]|nr:MAG: triosephosphate isomerase [uncultured bacterium]
MKLLVANWKSNMNLSKVQDWLKEFALTSEEQKYDSTKIEVIIAPSVTFLEIIKNTGLIVSAQDVSIYEPGAHTGEITAEELKTFCKYCVVGHSERNEPIEIVEQKRDICLEHGITPIICFIKPTDAKRLYKPGCVMTLENPDNISQNGKYRPDDPVSIKTKVDEVEKLLPTQAKILYGGSVNRQNVSQLVNIKRLDGFLVGQASLDPLHFFELISAVEVSIS